MLFFPPRLDDFLREDVGVGDDGTGVGTVEKGRGGEDETGDEGEVCVSDEDRVSGLRGDDRGEYGDAGEAVLLEWGSGDGDVGRGGVEDKGLVWVGVIGEDVRVADGEVEFIGAEMGWDARMVLMFIGEAGDVEVSLLVNVT